jgi:hypothetical protein
MDESNSEDDSDMNPDDLALKYSSAGKALMNRLTAVRVAKTEKADVFESKEEEEEDEEETQTSSRKRPKLSDEEREVVSSSDSDSDKDEDSGDDEVEDAEDEVSSATTTSNVLAQTFVVSDLLPEFDVLSLRNLALASKQGSEGTTRALTGRKLGWGLLQFLYKNMAIEALPGKLLPTRTEAYRHAFLRVVLDIYDNEFHQADIKMNKVRHQEREITLRQVQTPADLRELFENDLHIGHDFSVIYDNLVTLSAVQVGKEGTWKQLLDDIGEAGLYVFPKYSEFKLVSAPWPVGWLPGRDAERDTKVRSRKFVALVRLSRRYREQGITLFGPADSKLLEIDDSLHLVEWLRLSVSVLDMLETLVVHHRPVYGGTESKEEIEQIRKIANARNHKLFLDRLSPVYSLSHWNPFASLWSQDVNAAIQRFQDTLAPLWQQRQGGGRSERSLWGNRRELVRRLKILLSNFVNNYQATQSFALIHTEPRVAVQRFVSIVKAALRRNGEREFASVDDIAEATKQVYRLNFHHRPLSRITVLTGFHF